MLAQIEQARRRLDVTAIALAAEAGIHHSTYFKARAAGRARPSTIRRLIAALERIEAQRALAARRLSRIGAEPREAA